VFRKRISGCVCHHEQLLAGNPIICNKKGRNAKYLKGLLLEWFEEIKDSRLHLETEDIPIAYQSAVTLALDFLLGMGGEKFAYVDLIPWLIWQCDRPDIAQQFIKLYRSEMSTPTGAANMHYVGHYFAGDVDKFEESLLLDMESHAAENGMSTDLRTAITSYQLAKVDEGRGESIHARANRVICSKPNSSSHLWSAEVRLEHNLDFYERCDNIGLAKEFEHAYRNWKCILQPTFSKFLKGIPVRVGTQLFLDRVYRTGECAEADWSHLGKGVASIMPKNTEKSFDFSLEMQCDYLRCVLTNGAVYTLPILTSPPAYENMDDVDAAGLLVEMGASKKECVCFRVVELNPTRFNLIGGGTCPDGCTLPVMFQMLGVSPFNEYPPDQLSIYQVGSPIVKNAFAVADWKLWRVALRRWPSVQTSDVYGCQDVADYAFARPDADEPAITLVESLLLQRWVPGKVEGGHVPGDKRRVFALRFELKKFQNQIPKNYYRCLLTLMSLFNDGLPVLPINQHEKFYQCVLLLKDKSLVKPGSKVSDYDALLKDVEGHGVVSALPRDDGSDDGAKSSVCSGGDDDEPECSTLVPSQPKKARTARAELAPVDLSSLIWNSAQADGVVHNPAELASESSGSSSRSSTPRGSRHTASGSEEDQPIARIDDLPDYESWSKVVGGNLKFDQFGDAGVPGSYSRLIVRCRCHAHNTTKDCMKKRNLGPSQVAAYGALEPIGFSGAWMERASDYENQFAHNRFSPNLNEVRKFMELHKIPVN
jgi:hypothetical protein